MKAKLLKSLKRTLIAVGVLLVLTAVAGVGYIWYSGQQAPVVAEQKPAAQLQTPPPAHTAPVIAPDATVSASVQSIDSPVAPGQNVSLQLRTNPAAKCKISVVYDKTPSKDSGLMPKIADEYGMVSWTWTVDASAPLGNWPVKVTCANDKKSADVQADLTVAKPTN